MIDFILSEDGQTINSYKSPKEEKKDTVIDFESRKKELMELKQMLQESQSQEQGSEQEIHHGRRAA